MEILRVPPYPIVTTWDVPEAEQTYLVYVEDVVDHTIETTEVTSTVDSQITYSLPRSKVQFDRDFLFRIYDTDIYGEIVVDSNLTIYRPYVDPNMLATTGTPSEIAEYKRWEIIARSMIDSYLSNDSATGEGFYNHKLIVQEVGQGTDYFPIWHNPKKVLKVYENNVLVYNGEDVPISVTGIQPLIDGTTMFATNVVHDLAIGDTVTFAAFVPEEYNGNYKVSEIVSPDEFIIKKTFTESADTYGTMQRYWESKFVITPNNSAIMRLEVGLYNRAEKKPTTLPQAVGDLNYYGQGRGTAFPRGVDYVFILDVGYKAIPPDVEIATTMLIDDLKCGRNDYYQRFVTQYSTDQFDIKFAPAMLGGTGNLIVDKILDGYKGNVIKPGII
jgi:hypothetical protein